MYPTDLILTQWQFIKKTLDFDDRKRKHDLCIIWNAIYYIVKTGCQLANTSFKLSQMAIGLLLLL
ncbi:transposase [Chryseobacterium sp. ERMR1:04]|uniref:transposase n=1 Tax=Chryseobacterium sp. ERMR1:04 TaxID=1705393 RepID=UPI0009E6E30A|nr:transposase [Chryseobacterium sp. ERMR1:04]